MVGSVWDDTCSSTNSYWIKETTGQQTSAVGYAETVSALTKQASYRYWNFTNTWTIDEGKSLAYLQGRSVPDAIYKLVESYPVMDGNGTLDAPFIVTSAVQLTKVAQDMNAYYKLGADIDLSGISNWTAIGTEEEPFKGSFDGNGYTISNMKINSSKDFQGLFGYTDSATIQNLTIKDYKITASGSYLGGLVGYSYQTDISNVHTIGKIYYGKNSVCMGGIVGCYEIGTMGPNIKKCHTEGQIRYNSDSYSTSYKVYGGYAGGIAGLFDGVAVTATRGYACEISNSYSTMSVTANYYAGGLVGMLGGERSDSGFAYIKTSYAIGRVYGDSDIGGLVGIQSGLNELGVYDSYYDTETTEQEESAGGAGRTTEQMKLKSNYGGWDFTNTWEIEEGEYPTLK